MNWEEEHQKLMTIKQRISDLNADLKESKESLEQQQYIIIKAMDEVGLTNIRTEHGSVSRNTRTVLIRLNQSDGRSGFDQHTY